MKPETQVVGRTTIYLAAYPPRGRGDTIARFSLPSAKRRAIRKDG